MTLHTTTNWLHFQTAVKSVDFASIDWIGASRTTDSDVESVADVTLVAAGRSSR